MKEAGARRDEESDREQEHSPFELVRRSMRASERRRLEQLIDRLLLRELLEKGVFVAGGAVVCALVADVDPCSVGDVDVFVAQRGGQELFGACAEIVGEHLPQPKRYFRQESTLKIHARGRCPCS
jgi:hypothetical protein